MGTTSAIRAAAAKAPKAIDLADALFSGTQQRVLGLLFGQPERSFYATELIALAGAGSGAVQRELARLAQSGLVTVEPLANRKHYRANPASPIYTELCAIARKTIAAAEPPERVKKLQGNKLGNANLQGNPSGTA